MARVKLDLPDSFQFSTEISIRINDINYGGHLGNDTVLSLVHEARVRFLKHLGFTEKDIGGNGIIMSDAIVVYKAEGFYGEMLTIEVTVGEFSSRGCDFLYRLSNKENGKEIARVKTGIVFYDYENKKIVSVPDVFKSIIEKL
ncbi:MAG: thioesterase family protein [Ignavibacteriales bacterium]|nr:thioesterase family protein [Ignavibacteriales bacterium]